LCVFGEVETTQLPCRDPTKNAQLCCPATQKHTTFNGWQQLCFLRKSRDESFFSQTPRSQGDHSSQWACFKQLHWSHCKASQSNGKAMKWAFTEWGNWTIGILMKFWGLKSRREDKMFRGQKTKHRETSDLIASKSRKRLIDQISKQRDYYR
jgi:hypothetical protein